MRPARRIKQAEEVARSLKALLSSSILSQLLQRTPPAALTAEQEAQLSSCCYAITQLEVALDEAPSIRMQMMDAMLKQQMACHIGALVTWVQQQPEQHLFGLRAAAVAGHQGSGPVTCVAGTATATTWAAGVQVLDCFAHVATLQPSECAGACSLAEKLTQQLDQSGKVSSRNCKGTARQCCNCREVSCMHV
jgi:hypothetical protein